MKEFNENIDYGKNLLNYGISDIYQDPSIKSLSYLNEPRERLISSESFESICILNNTEAQNNELLGTN